MNNKVRQSRLEDPVFGDEPICVMGSSDRRFEFREMQVGTKKVPGTLRTVGRSDLAKKIKITRAGSPVGNRFEKDKSLTRIEQINAFKEEVQTLWIDQGQMPKAVDQWLTARANEMKSGRKLNLVCDCRERVHRNNCFLHKQAPPDCHGYTLALLILERSGDITELVDDPELIGDDPPFVQSAVELITRRKELEEKAATEVSE